MSINKVLVKDLREALERVDNLQAENDRLREAILTWWRGSPEDTVSDDALRSIAEELR
jgi:hypothetical protein